MKNKELELKKAVTFKTLRLSLKKIKSNYYRLGLFSISFCGILNR